MSSYKTKDFSTDCISMHDDTSAWVQAYITVDCSLGECMISPELDLHTWFYVCVFMCVWGCRRHIDKYGWLASYFTLSRPIN